jgi:hypothetical protein
MNLFDFIDIDQPSRRESKGVVLAGTNINRGKIRMRFYKQTRWFEVYFEVKGCTAPSVSPFYERRSEGNDHEIWFGRCYLAVHTYRRKATGSGVEGAKA